MNFAVVFWFRSLEFVEDGIASIHALQEQRRAVWIFSFLPRVEVCKFENEVLARTLEINSLDKAIDEEALYADLKMQCSRELQQNRRNCNQMISQSNQRGRKRRGREDYRSYVEGIWPHLERHFNVFKKPDPECGPTFGVNCHGEAHLVKASMELQKAMLPQIFDSLAASKLAIRKRRRRGYLERADLELAANRVAVIPSYVKLSAQVAPEPLYLAKLPEHYIVCTQLSSLVGEDLHH